MLNSYVYVPRKAFKIGSGDAMRLITRRDTLCNHSNLFHELCYVILALSEPV